jgi:hypothetical protein
MPRADARPRNSATHAEKPDGAAKARSAIRLAAALAAPTIRARRFDVNEIENRGMAAF